MTRPFVFINSAMSTDGKISSVERRQVRISGKEDMARVDILRAESDAVMVGVGTVLADDPSLRVKSPELRIARRERGQTEEPLRIVADSRARTPQTARILGPGCIIAVARCAPQERLERLTSKIDLSKCNPSKCDSSKCEIMVCGKDKVDLEELFSRLFDKGIKRIMVEGGATLNWSLLNLGLVDELYVYVGDMLIGGENAPTLVDGQGFKKDFPRLTLRDVQRLDGGVLLKWKLPSGLPERP